MLTSDKMTQQESELLNSIRQELARKLNYYGLEGRIEFDSSALQELGNLSAGNMQHASFYAGLAILDALKNQSPVITVQDIKKVDIFEAIQLITKKDFWNYLPEQLNQWDTERVSDANDAIREARLPKYALTDRIQLAYDDVTKRGEIYIDFKYDPYTEEIKAVAHHFANFVSDYTKEPQVVRNSSNDLGTFFYVYNCLMFKGVGVSSSRPINSVVIVDELLRPVTRVNVRYDRLHEDPRRKLFQNYVLSVLSGK